MSEAWIAMPDTEVAVEHPKLSSLTRLADHAYHPRIGNFFGASSPSALSSRRK